MMNNLPNLPNDNKQPKQNVEDLMKAATEYSANTEVETAQTNVKPLKKIFTIGGGVMAGFAGLLLIGAIIINTKPQEFENKNKETVNKETQHTTEKKVEDMKWKFSQPVDTPSWTKQEYNAGAIFADEETKQEMLNYSKEIQGFSNAISWMPSGVKGNWEGAEEPYTNELSHKYKKDKSGAYTNEINPKFKYVLKEDYEKAYVSSVQRLVNPIFGEWIFAQRAEGRKLYNDNTFEVLKDMFHAEWWAANVKENEDYSKLPILADWDADNFGGLKLAERIPGRYGTFFGVINETQDIKVQASYIGIDKNGEAIIETITPIKYVAFGENDTKIEKYGTLKLTFSSNTKSYQTNNRVLVSNAELTIH